ncbi:ROK family protein [Yoonia sp.]|uniref:ROK family protein n=1 Tax=Yoonia sp. TaxID=2212373 RepID=UPI0025FDA2BF|nr:ROK family protein [Yoonia sp.]
MNNMQALGLDIGGTKIEAQIFHAGWGIHATRRIETPRDYTALLVAIADLVAWADSTAGRALPVGIGAAGLINPADGTALTANLAATGRPLPADIMTAVGRPVTYLNDCRALTLSEAVFGAGRPHRSVMALILGTGVGGGIAIDGHLLNGPTQTGGEFGHIAASAQLVIRHNLPVVACGCGRVGCIETLISGPGLTRIGNVTTGRALGPPALIAARSKDAGAQAAWDIWCALTADLIRTLILTVDPGCIILGGGLSNVADVVPDLQAAVAKAQFAGFAVPPIVLASGGDTSGARGAAYAATKGVT